MTVSSVPPVTLRASSADEVEVARPQVVVVERVADGPVTVVVAARVSTLKTRVPSSSLARTGATSRAARVEGESDGESRAHAGLRERSCHCRATDEKGGPLGRPRRTRGLRQAGPPLLSRARALLDRPGRAGAVPECRARDERSENPVRTAPSCTPSGCAG